MTINLLNKLLTTEFFFCFIIFVSTCLKLYRVLFYLRVMLEILPLYNGYKWPMSLIYFLTNPISKFYRLCLPSVYIPSFAVDPTIFLTVEIFAILIDFIEDIKDAFSETIFS